jgi:D-glycero-D-manno-heptose 1,7-bisphosphate phosphatase
MLPWGVDKTWTLFLDRDGVINERIMGGYVTNPSEFHFLDLVPNAISRLNKKFNLTLVVTNQQGIAKNIMTSCNLEEVHRYMIERLNQVGAKIDKVYNAPGFKSEENSIRKPNPGMAIMAQKDYPEIVFEKSIMIGDTDSDIKFGKNLGMKTVRVKTIEPINIEADLTVESLYEFSKLI